MATYIIGDVQGCYRELQRLLQHLAFDERNDQLGFVGDLVNRGPDSLAVLRFIKRLKNAWVVLGNHDLFLLTLGYNLMPRDRYPHTLEAILNAADKNELLDWLRYQPLIRPIETEGVLLVHAGLPPQWTIQQSLTHAHEVETALRGPHYQHYLANLFGDQPTQWSAGLNGSARLRYITNALVRMRFCDRDGTLDLHTTNKYNDNPAIYRPWFEWRDSERDDHSDILFGHWAALDGACTVPGYHALDTGCVWGRCLTALRLQDKRRLSVPCQSAYKEP